MPQSIKIVVSELHASRDDFPELVIDRATENTIANRLKIVDRDPTILVAAIREVARRRYLHHAHYVSKRLPKQRDALMALAHAAADRALTDRLREDSRAQHAAAQRQRDVEARRQESLLIDRDAVRRLWPRLNTLEFDAFELRSRAVAARFAQLATAGAGRYRGLSGHRRDGPMPDAVHLAEALEALVPPTQSPCWDHSRGATIHGNVETSSSIMSASGPRMPVRSQRPLCVAHSTVHV